MPAPMSALLVHYERGQRAAILKLGYDLDDAAGVLRAAKKYTLPKAGNRALSTMQGLPDLPSVRRAAGAASLHSVSSNIAGNKAMYGRVAKAVPEKADEFNQLVATLTPESPQFASVKAILGNSDKGAIFKGTADPRRTLAPKHMQPAMNPNQHKMLHSIVGGHELDELTAKMHPAMLDKGHLSPDVMMREHNRVATMPEGFDPVRNMMQTARSNMGEADQLAEYGITYGQGDRLSRHQRKNIARLMEQDLIRTQRETL